MGCGEGRCVGKIKSGRQCMKWATEKEKAVWDDDTRQTYHLVYTQMRTCTQHRSQEPKPKELKQ